MSRRRAPFVVLASLLMLIAGCSSAPPSSAATVTTITVKVAPAPVAAPVRPTMCADYQKLEAGHGEIRNQDTFNHLDVKGYARLRSACVYGWAGYEWTCLEKLWTGESSWRTNAGHPNGSYGIPQSYPGTKMRAAGADWLTNPRTQVRWGLSYIKTHPGYGRPTRATFKHTPCVAGY